MRCLNCHTVLMDNDTECPVCHAGIQLRACEMPQPEDSGTKALRGLAGFAGGAVGVMLFNAVNGTGAAVPCVRPGSAGGSPRPQGGGGARRVFGVLILLVGGFLIAAAVGGLLKPQAAGEQQPRTVTAADLRQLDEAGALPGGPVAYTVLKAKPTGLERVRRRTERGEERTGHIFLLQVEDKWLVAAVPSGFSGSRLVGRLERLDTPESQALVDNILASEPNPPALLSFELNMVDPIETQPPAHYVAAGLLAFVGLLGVLQGLRMIAGGSRHAAPTPASQQSTGLTVQLPRNP